MIVEYDVVCFERTLQFKLDDKYEHLREIILKSFDKHYDEWQNDDNPCMCLEEFIIEETCNELNLFYEEWDSIPYGDDYEPRETLWVCEHCFAAIENHEGNQARLTHGVDDMDAVDSKCGWCGQVGFDTLYELV